MVSQLRNICQTIHNMPNQLYIQAFITIQLILETIQIATLYFVQRQPKELGDIAWVIDRKNRTITQMEDTWKTLILPIGEYRFAKTPLGALPGADYSHFDSRYAITSAGVDCDMARHLEWVRTTYGIHQRSGEKSFLDAKLLLTEQLKFMDSRDSLGLQLADMLATILRRALNGLAGRTVLITVAKVDDKTLRVNVPLWQKLTRSRLATYPKGNQAQCARQR
jgi:hypothetical protein